MLSRLAPCSPLFTPDAKPDKEKPALWPSGRPLRSERKLCRIVRGIACA
jgi:hypothetical protein